MTRALLRFLPGEGRPGSSGRRLQALGWILAAAVVYIPLILLLIQSFSSGGQLSLGNYTDVLSRHAGLLFLGSAGMAAAAAILSLFLGTLIAIFLETRRVPFRPFLRLIALAPILLPPYMQVAAWKPLVVSAAAHAEWIRIPAVILILGLASAPVVFFFASQGIRGISGDLLDAARLAPISEWGVAVRVILPLAAPAIAAGTAIAFVIAFLEQETPALLLVPAAAIPSYSMFIFYQVARGPGAAFAAAVPVILLSLTVVVLAERWTRRKGFSVTSSENPRAPLPARKTAPAALLVLAAFGVLVVGLPVGRLLGMAGRFGTYRQAFDLYGAELLEGFPITLGSALIATALAALTLGRRGRPSAAAAVVAWIPLAVPGTALGAAIIETYNRPGLEAIYESRWILVIAAVARFFPLAYFALAAHLRTIPGELWEAASLAGLPPARRLVQVYLPLAAPGLALAAAAVAVFQSGEVAAAVLLAPPGHRPVPVAIASELHYNVNLDVPAALCLFQSAAVLMMIGAIRIPARFLTAGPRRGLARTTTGGPDGTAIDQPS